MNSLPELTHLKWEICVPKPSSLFFVSKLHNTTIYNYDYNTKANYPLCAQCGWIQPHLKKKGVSRFPGSQVGPWRSQISGDLSSIMFGSFLLQMHGALCTFPSEGDANGTILPFAITSRTWLHFWVQSNVVRILCHWRWMLFDHAKRRFNRSTTSCHL